MNILSNIGKSTLLAMCIFWAINFTEDFDPDLLPFVLLSIIPICFCVSLVILTTICPVFWFFGGKNFDKNKVFKSYFPYYSIIAFSICVFCSLLSNSEIYFISFFITAYLTTAQSWVWFAKEK